MVKPTPSRRKRKPRKAARKLARKVRAMDRSLALAKDVMRQITERHG